MILKIIMRRMRDEIKISPAQHRMQRGYPKI